ncbi:hypothetical protein [Psychroserpens luteolus]|uniref:hypothetical protein n=1 Tax=Psychroserpens luteolus TaxID=2855840 RepID=UPI001E61CEFD|nr:hypothetical protein [Psychroserpens luteolus]MCD2259495.1 hypothetical protein [Psychroserpens luteolus]
MKNLLLILLISNLGFSQSSITQKDIEICTQLTLLNVSKEDDVNFKKHLKTIADKAKEFKIDYEYDWLTYKTEKGEYLIVNFSDDLKSILTLSDYRKVFTIANSGQAFNKAISEISMLDVNVKFNYVKEMILPWSTVSEMSVSEFPYAEMIEFKISSQSFNKIDKVLRQLSKLLKDSNYPFPLETSRGAIGAYGKITLVWFYDDTDNFNGMDTPKGWMKNKGKLKEYNSLLNEFLTLTDKRKNYKLSYVKELSN